MWIPRHGILQSSKGINLLLDLYPSAAAAYSLRKLRSAYSGSAIRVRRSLDNTEQDIGFDGSGNLNESALNSFVGDSNLVQYSEQFNNAYWSVRTGNTISANATTAPDSTTTADKIVENTTASAFHGINTANYITIQGNNFYTWSIYCKAAGRDFAYVQVVTADNSLTNVGTSYFYVSLTDGSTTAISDITAGLTNKSCGAINVGNGWWRVYFIFKTASTAVNCNVYLFSATNSTTNNYTGDGSSGVFIWGGQFTNTSVLTNYKQTTSTTFTGIGYITKWYDQSGNGRDASQTTQANQPLISIGGVINKINNKPSINYNSNNCKLQVAHSTAFNYSSSNYISIFILFSGTKNNTTPRLIDKNNGASDKFLLYCNASTGNPFNEINTATSTISTDALSSSLVLLSSINNANSQMFLNSTTSGTAVSLSGISNTNTDVMNIGGTSDNTRTMLGNFSELVFYNSDKSTSRTSIESNINSYFSIY